MVARLAVMSSPSFPSPLDNPILNSHFYILMKLICHQFLVLHYRKAENPLFLDKKFKYSFFKIN